MQAIRGRDDTEDVLKEKWLKLAYTKEEPRDQTRPERRGSLWQALSGIRRPARACYFPKIVWFIRSTTPRVCDSVKWVYLLVIWRVLCPKTSAISANDA